MPCSAKRKYKARRCVTGAGSLVGDGVVECPVTLTPEVIASLESGEEYAVTLSYGVRHDITAAGVVRSIAARKGAAQALEVVLLDNGLGGGGAGEGGSAHQSCCNQCVAKFHVYCVWFVFFRRDSSFQSVCRLFSTDKLLFFICFVKKIC